MAASERPHRGGVVEEATTISTGQTVELPVRTEGTMLGAVFAAPRRAVSDLLPDGLSPIRATPAGKAAVTFLSVAYHSVDVEGLEPYNEFAVILPATHESSPGLPYLSALTQATDGYVWYMPVTTDPARAFGVEVWGFPKVVGDITHDDTGSTRETTVTIDGDRFVTFECARPPSMETQDTGFSYTSTDDELIRVPHRIDADAGLWPFSTDVSVTFGDHPKADDLRNLTLGPRALARVSVDGEAFFYPGQTV